MRAGARRSAAIGAAASCAAVLAAGVPAAAAAQGVVAQGVAVPAVAARGGPGGGVPECAAERAPGVPGVPTAPCDMASTGVGGERGAAPGSEPLTVGDAVRLALARHPTLVVANAAVDGAASGVAEARAARLPTLTAEASLSRFQEPMVVAPLHGFDPLRPPTFDRTVAQGSVTLGYTLFDGGARGARIERAEALTDAAVAELDGARQGLIARTVGAYVRVRTAREVLEANERRVAAVERERDRAAQFLERGRGARVALLRAEAAVSGARAEAYATRSELEVAERDLARLVGVEPARVAAAEVAPVRLAPAKAAPARPAVLDRALAGNAELARLERRVAAAEATRSEARASWYPRVRAVGRYVEYAGGAGREQGEWQGGVQLEYPFLTGGARGAAGQRADAELRGAGAALDAARMELEGAVDRALSTLGSEGARVEALRAAVAQSEEVVRVEKLALDAGAGVQSDYLAAEAELLRARAALSAARAAEVAAWVELARLAGELTVEWLGAHLETGS